MADYSAAYGGPTSYSATSTAASRKDKKDAMDQYGIDPSQYGGKKRRKKTRKKRRRKGGFASNSGKKKADQRCYSAPKGKKAAMLQCPCPEDNQINTYGMYKFSPQHTACDKSRKKGPAQYVNWVKGKKGDWIPHYPVKGSAIHMPGKSGPITNGQELKVLIEQAGKAKEYDAFYQWHPNAIEERAERVNPSAYKQKHIKLGKKVVNPNNPKSGARAWLVNQNRSKGIGHKVSDMKHALRNRKNAFKATAVNAMQQANCPYVEDQACAITQDGKYYGDSNPSRYTKKPTPAAGPAYTGDASAGLTTLSMPEEYEEPLPMPRATGDASAGLTTLAMPEEEPLPRGVNTMAAMSKMKKMGHAHHKKKPTGDKSKKLTKLAMPAAQPRPAAAVNLNCVGKNGKPSSYCKGKNETSKGLCQANKNCKWIGKGKPPKATGYKGKKWTVKKKGYFKKGKLGKKGGKRKSRKRRKKKRGKKSRKKSRKKRRRKSRRRRGGIVSQYQLKSHPIIPSMKFGCGAFDSACKSARTASKQAGNNSAYCQYVTPKLEAFVQKNSGKCFSDMKTVKNLKWQTPWQRAAQAKCISDEAVCPTNYPGKGYRPPKMVANIAEAEQKMGGKFGIFTGIVNDFGGDKNKAFEWLQDKQTKEMAAYNKAMGSRGGKRRKSRRKKRRKSRKKRRRSRRRRR